MTEKSIVWTVIGITAVAVFFVLLKAHRLKQPIAIEGAVVEGNPDTRKERPIDEAIVTASDGVDSVTTHSDSAGYFKLVLKKQLLSGKPIMLSLRRSDYAPLDLYLPTGWLHTRKELYVERMQPIAPQVPASPNKKQEVVSEVRVRYTINARTENDVGSAVKTFQVVNQANIPCNRQGPCSPDGKWKATSGSATLYAGTDNVFNNIRASCIAGPCPFTSIDSSGLVNGKHAIQVSALDWSETATFLLESEVFHTEITSNVRRLYPVIFGRGLNFTMPPTAEGVSIEAEIDGTPMVFPLSPSLDMSWASCTIRSGTEAEKIAVYRCQLKPDYKF